MTPGYRALRESAARLDLSWRTKIVATGEDRARLLHALTTNHILDLSPGTGCYTFFLNAQGRIQADAEVLVFEDHILLDMEPETRERMLQHIDHYIIADDVTLEDATGRLAELAVEGPAAAENLRALGAPVPESDYAHLPWQDGAVARLSWTGAPGFRVYLPAEQRNDLIAALDAAIVPAAAGDEARLVRLENGKPRYGEDINDATLPQETQLSAALSFSKGCYLGQEIVERIRSRGHVNRLLTRLEFDGVSVPCPPPKLLSNGAEAGHVTSLAASPTLGRVVGLGYVRAQFAKPGAEFELDGLPGTARADGPARH
jgi:aminomethyltransferase